MRSDGRDNTKKVPSNDKNENKTYLNRYSNFEESLPWRASESIRDNKYDYNDKSK